MPTPATAPSMISERRNDTIQTPEKSTPATCLTSTSFVEDFPAKATQWQDSDLASLTPEELSFLKFPDWLKQNDLRICCSKMCLMR